MNRAITDLCLTLADSSYALIRTQTSLEVVVTLNKFLKLFVVCRVFTYSVEQNLLSRVQKCNWSYLQTESNLKTQFREHCYIQVRQRI